CLPKRRASLDPTRRGPGPWRFFVKSYGFDVSKLQHSISRQFATEAAVLDATKGDSRIRNDYVVNAYEAGCNLSGDLFCSSNVLPPDASSKPEAGQVGELDSLIIIFHNHDRGNGSESFLRHNTHLGANVGQNR